MFTGVWTRQTLISLTIRSFHVHGNQGNNRGMDFFKQETIGDLIRCDRRVFIECRASPESWCNGKSEIDLIRFPRDMPWQELENKKFVCSRCGGRKFRISREIERAWKRRIKRR